MVVDNDLWQLEVSLVLEICGVVESSRQDYFQEEMTILCYAVYDDTELIC